ncbi:TetR/AcrR family transcriptional regulator [Parvibaculaceae bacterium PLY_AMNH_Bact1]|nr:TetR/AcrR family transcriptional regulator [Parvibaculaceae bacterium PLY_AMNH_Bact1]
MSGKAKTTYHHGGLRDALLREAPACIAEQGLDKFTLRGLARDLGVTHGAVYRHFADKRELLVALALAGHKDFAQTLRMAASSGGDVEGAIKSVARAYVRWSLANESAYQIMFGPRLNEDGRHPELEEAIEGTFFAVDILFKPHSISKARARHLSVSLMTQLHGYCDLVRLRRIRVRGVKAAETYLLQSINPLVRGLCAELDE